jgi:hypothetical protein
VGVARLDAETLLPTTFEFLIAIPGTRLYKAADSFEMVQRVKREPEAHDIDFIVAPLSLLIIPRDASLLRGRERLAIPTTTTTESSHHDDA